MNLTKTLALIFIALPLTAQNINWNQIRNPPFLNVTNYGATGDGTTDDKAAIQAAIDAADDVGGVVYLPRGTYGLTGPLVMRINTVLRCEGYGLQVSGPTTTIKSLASWSKTSGDALVMNDPTTNSVGSSIENCTLLGNASTGPDYGIYYINGNTFNLTNVLVNTCRLSCIYLDSDGMETAQSGTFQNVTVYNAVQDTGLADHWGAIHLKWTDIVLNAVYAATSSEDTYTQSGRRVACLFAERSDSGAMTNTDCSHSEVGVRIESGNWRVASSRSQFNAGDGWQITGSKNTFASIQSHIDGGNDGITSYGFLVSGSGNNFASVSITTNCSLGTTYCVDYAIRHTNTNNPPNSFMGVLGAGGTGTISATDTEHLMVNSLRQVPAGTYTSGADGAVDVELANFVFLGNGTSAPYTVTGLTKGTPGQMVTFVYTGDTNPPSIAATATIKLTKTWTGFNQNGQPNSSITLVTPDGTTWYEVARNDINDGIVGSPSNRMWDNSETSNNKYSDWSSNTGNQQLLGRVCNDAINSCNPWVEISRSGATPSAVAHNTRVVLGAGVSADDGTHKVQITGNVRSVGTTHGSLGTPSNGVFIYCSDCQVTSSSDNTCASGGTGAMAIRLNSVWRCFDVAASSSTPTALLQVAENATDNRLAKSVGTSGRTMEATGVTVDDSNNISTAGSISSGVGGSVAGGFEMTQGTLPTPSSNSIVINAPTSVSTAYQFTLPGAAATGFRYGTNSSNVVTETFVAAASHSEVTTGTDASKPITPDALAGSLTFGVKVVQVEVFSAGTAASTGDGKAYFYIPASLNGMNLISITGQVYTVGTTNLLNVDIARCATVATGNVCSGTVSDVLSTNLTIDSNEDDSGTAAAAAVIDAANDDVATGQVYRIDVDAVHDTPSQGLLVILTFQLP